ncbi:RIO1 family regulatory kinase/ATPase [Brevibacterium aurantiacum]|uniref:non-specific serine/threonine protein kinase n=1 Tax=Brevibacterium aurantiacum TaxID=273384 RepID=A0A3Q9NQT6_BREAU|nr:RIO1 family regulatory kinase/ATPase [Brevibacterium aurantiacum]AZT92949.1 hypothetical protein CXR23_07175 [Brevibacterium aurantiacum]
MEKNVEPRLDGDEGTRPVEDYLIGVSLSPVMEQHLPSVLTALNAHGFEYLTTLELNLTTASSVVHARENGADSPQHKNARTVVCLDFHALGANNRRRSYSNRDTLSTSIGSGLRRLTNGRIDADNIELEPFEREQIDRLLEAPSESGTSQLAERLQHIRQTLYSPYPVLETHAHGERAIVRSVLHPTHGRAVLKTFRSGAMRAAQRERTALEALRAESCVPRLLDHTKNSLLIELIDDDGTHIRRRLPGVEEVQLESWAVDQLVELVKCLRSQGLYLIDLASHNLMSTGGALKLIDLEFCYEYEDALPELVNDQTIIGTLPAHLVPESELFLIGTDTQWWNRILLSAFHPAITGASPRRLLKGSVTRIEQTAIQRFWYVVYVCLSPVRPFKRAVDSLRSRCRLGVDAKVRLGL